MTVDEARLADRVEDWHRDHACPGASVALVDGTETVFAAGVGERRLDPAQPATPETRYRVGSVSKPVTATAVFALVEDGTVDLNDPVAEYVPAFDPPGEPVSVGELLSHTAGMPEDGAAARLADRTLDLGIDHDADLGDWAGFESFLSAHLEDRRDDGRFRYYNSGYAVLGRLLEVLAGDPFPEVVRERVFDPLGMDAATFDPAVVNRHLEGDDGGADVACPYAPDDGTEGEFDPVPAPDAPPMAPAGGLVASVQDLAAFAAGFAAGEFPVGQSLRDRMAEPAVAAETFLDGRTRAYGHGWYHVPFGDDALLGHPGHVDGGSGYVGVLRDRGLGVAVGCNAIAMRPAGPSGLATALLAVATGRDPATVSPSVERQVEAITGRYEATTGLDAARVTWDGDESTLRVEIDSAFETFEQRFWPAGATPTGRTFRRVGPEGELFEAHFRTDRDPVEFETSSLRFRRVGDSRGE